MAKLAALDLPDKRGRARKLLRSRRLALLYAYEALRRVHRLHRASPATIGELADRCNPFAASREAVQRVTVSSGTDRRRTVQNFGPLKRMHHMLVADVVAALHPPRRDQYLFNGGMPKALAAIEAAFRKGYMYAAEVDLFNFYGCVRLPGLAEMLHPLPASVVEHVIWDYACRRGPDDDLAMPCDDAVSPSHTGLVGLALGAATSPIVGECIIGKLLGSARHERVVAYADNVLVLGRDRREVEARYKHLEEQALRLEAGPVWPRMGRVASFRDQSGGVEFAKQWGQAIRHRLNWMPNAEKQAEHRAADWLEQMTLAQIDEAERKVTAWRRSYPMWRTGDIWEAERLAELAAARYYRGGQPENLTAARQALLIACFVHRDHCAPYELAPDWPSALHQRRRQTLLASTNALLDLMRGSAQTGSVA